MHLHMVNACLHSGNIHKYHSCNSMDHGADSDSSRMILLPYVHPSPHPSQQDAQIINYVFPMGAPFPTCPNMDPQCNHLALCSPGLPMAIFPLVREASSFHLTDYLECKFVSIVLNIIDVGASISHLGPQNSQPC